GCRAQLPRHWMLFPLAHWPVPRSTPSHPASITFWAGHVSLFARCFVGVQLVPVLAGEREGTG
ncbi:hypothetical protein ACXWP9_09565, partial [Streptococcus pyogenes]